MEDIYKYPHKVSNCKYYVVDICLEKSTNIEILIKCYPQYPQKKVCRKINGLRMVFCIIHKVMHKLSTIWG